MSAAHQVVAAKKQTTICEASIVAATFNATKTQIAFSPNNNLVYIADVAGDDCTQWKIKETLSGHDQAVSCIDWSPVTEKLLTCSHDRTAFVWTRAADKGPWQPVLILLDSAMKHGFTCCKWSLSGLKLYVSCASSTVAVGKYDEESDWWRCSVFKPHCSSVTCVAPHTVNDSLLATAATDHTVKVISTFTKSIDPPESRLAKLGAEVAHFDVQSWVNAIAWSESGCILAVACHDSSVTIFSGSHPTDFANWSAQVILLPQLPLRAIAFVAEDAVVGGGHDYYPVYFAPGADGQWAVKGTGAQITKKADEKLTGTQAARLRFQNEASHGTTESVELPKTRHSNTVTSVLPLPRKRFATASADGRVEIWALDQLLS